MRVYSCQRCSPTAVWPPFLPPSLHRHGELKHLPPPPPPRKRTCARVNGVCLGPRCYCLLCWYHISGRRGEWGGEERQGIDRLIDCVASYRTGEKELAGDWGRNGVEARVRRPRRQPRGGAQRRPRGKKRSGQAKWRRRTGQKRKKGGRGVECGARRPRMGMAPGDSVCVCVASLRESARARAALTLLLSSQW